MKEIVFQNAVNLSGNHNANRAKEPFDANKYHRAFVAGLMGLPGGLTAFVYLFCADKCLEAVVTLAVSFLTPFTIQLGIEYGIDKAK